MTTAIAAPTSSSLFEDAAAASFIGDYFRAFRALSHLSTIEPVAFAKRGLEPYLRALFVLSDSFEAECGRLHAVYESKAAGEVSYLCGQELLENKQFTSAISSLARVRKDSRLFIPAQLLLASAELAKGSGKQALSRLNEVNVSKVRELGLDSLLQLTRARTLVSMARWDEAIKVYQDIPAESPQYIEALDESAWVFFKQRKFESSSVLLDVIINNYEGVERLSKNLKVTTSTYFRARYLKAYSALLQKRLQDADFLFTALKKDFALFKSETYKLTSAASSMNVFNSEFKRGFDPKTYPAELAKVLDVFESWSGSDSRRQMDRRILYHLAILRELPRLDIPDPNAEVGGYKKQLQSLQVAHWNLVDQSYRGLVGRLQRSLETFGLKTELGRMEIVWIKRAEGARSLDQVLENYREQMSSLDEFMEM